MKKVNTPFIKKITFLLLSLPTLFMLTSCDLIKKEKELSLSEKKTIAAERKKQFEYYFIREAGPPKMVKEGILFTYAEKCDSVELSGDFVSWEYTIPLNKGKYGIYYYVYTKEIEKGRYIYRYRVDGLWVNDPLQKNTTFDKNNQRVSYFTIENDINFHKNNPIKLADIRYAFVYSNETASHVFFACDYYDWNPTRFPMKKDNDGIWRIELDLPTDQIFYNFIVDSEWRTDPVNFNIYNDKEGREHSFVFLK